MPETQPQDAGDLHGAVGRFDLAVEHALIAVTGDVGDFGRSTTVTSSLGGEAGARGVAREDGRIEAGFNATLDDQRDRSSAQRA